MFLIVPLVLWWAQRPARFADRMWRRPLIGSLTASFLLVALCPASVQAQGPDFQSPRLRSQPKSSFRISQQPGTNPFGRDALNTSTGTATRKHSNQPKLREGTVMPMTEGRIIASGNRWMFSIQSGDDREHPSETNRDDRSDVSRDGKSNAFEQRARERRLDATMSFSPYENDSNGSNSASRGASGGNRKSFVITENLMLQRMIQAIRKDPMDNRWSVKGSLTEYFDENYLTIESVKRNTSPRKP